MLSSLNSQLNQYGISASTDNNGALQFSGPTAFTVSDPGTSEAKEQLAVKDSFAVGAQAFLVWAIKLAVGRVRPWIALHLSAPPTAPAATSASTAAWSTASAH